MEVCEQFGPEYNLESATLKKARKAARGGLQAMSRAERYAYGLAVETAVLASQRAALRRAGEPEKRPNCASGTHHNNGADIHKAIAAQQRAALLACPSQIRKARTAREWQEMYDAAMAEKHARHVLPLAA